MLTAILGGIRSAVLGNLSCIAEFWQLGDGLIKVNAGLSGNGVAGARRPASRQREGDGTDCNRNNRSDRQSQLAFLFTVPWPNATRKRRRWPRKGRSGKGVRRRNRSGCGPRRRTSCFPPAPSGQRMAAYPGSSAVGVPPIMPVPPSAPLRRLLHS